MDENKVQAAKRRVNNNVCRCQGIYMGVDDSLEKAFNLISTMLHEMGVYGIEDFKVGNRKKGVGEEIVAFQCLLDSYISDFHKLFEKYEDVEEGNKEWKD